MSKIALVALTCSACGQPQQHPMFDSVNGERMPHVEDEIVAGVFHRFTCSGCGVPAHAERRFLYTHLAAGQWLLVFPPDARPEFRRLEAEGWEIFHQEFQVKAPPLIRERAAYMRPRLVFGLRRLAERLRAHRLGLDDRLLECAKLLIWRERFADLAAAGPIELLLEGVTGGGDTLSFTLLALDEGPRGRLEVPRAVVTEVQERVSEYQKSLPELFFRPHLFVSALRYLL